MLDNSVDRHIGHLEASRTHPFLPQAGSASLLTDRRSGDDKRTKLALGGNVSNSGGPSPPVSALMTSAARTDKALLGPPEELPIGGRSPSRNAPVMPARTIPREQPVGTIAIE